ncbi:hypothetical protein SAMN02910418_02434 [Bowdeniella nasicola]|uniref:Uncharacterized protein n=1 Tax=Bowdeniella nasicola TaxID=208480 RepID=A0A1H4E3M9_9ACTO|nr:hypothetical protein [Bowdeniella nasicola]SEA79645.1 hypothetical protein SAMN02910418_02434 [Bowdeniella nasicola]
MADTINQSLSAKLHLASQETIVSRLLSSVLNSDQGPIVLSALLNRDLVSSTRILAQPEVRGDSGRYDILVAQELDGLLNLTIVEIKVAADQGKDQLFRYLGDTQSKRLIQALPPEFATMQLVNTPELVYLTISEEEVGSGVLTLTYRELQKRIDDRNPDNADIRELDWLLFRDLLVHLGMEYGPDAEFLSGLSAETTIQQIRDASSTERPLLQKKLARRICDVVLESLALDEGWETYSYSKPRGGAECGFYRSQWKRRGSEEYPGWEIHFSTDDLRSRILQNKAHTSLHVQFVPNPYQERKNLSILKQEWLESTKIALRESVQAQIGGVDECCPWQIKRSKLQFARANFELEPEDSLGELAQKFRRVATQLTPMIDRALETAIGD